MSRPAVRSDRDRFVAFAFTWADILLELDADERIAYAAGVLEVLVGRGKGALLGVAFTELVVPQQRAHARGLLARLRQCERIDDASLGLLGPNKAPVTFAVSGYRLPDFDGHLFIGLRGRARQVRDGPSACVDVETGLMQPRAFIESVGEHLSDGGPERAQRLSLIRVRGWDKLQAQRAPDDDLMRAAGECLRSHAVNGELAVRMAPDRFGLLHGAEVDSEKLKNELLLLFEEAGLPDEELAVECASFDMDSRALRTEQIAKGMVYIINRFRLADESGPASAPTPRSFARLAEQAAVAIDTVRNIVARSDYRVVFQAVVDAQSGDIHHYEALARFPRSNYLRSTAEHIMLAEEIGLIGELDLGMVRKVVERLNARGTHDSSSVAVNISGRSVNSAEYASELALLLNEHAWLQGRLMFEITESSRIENLQSANQFVLQLRSGGYPICLDDFGAGAANFQYLASLEVDIVKFDGPAVRCAQQNLKGTACLKALLTLCRELGIGTVLEMVDTPAGLQFARACGANYVQGYLFGKPHADIGVFERAVPRQLFHAAPATKARSAASVNPPSAACRPRTR